MEERHLSLSEAIDMLGISERTGYRWIKSGKLRAYKPGRDYWIPESAIREVVEESQVRPKGMSRSAYEPSFNDVLAAERRIDFEAYAASFDAFTGYWDEQVRVKGRRLDRQELHDYVEAVRAIVLSLREVMRAADAHDRSAMQPTLQRFVIVAYAVGGLAEDGKAAAAELAEVLQPLAA